MPASTAQVLGTECEARGHLSRLLLASNAAGRQRIHTSTSQASPAEATDTRQGREREASRGTGAMSERLPGAQGLLQAALEAWHVLAKVCEV